VRCGAAPLLELRCRDRPMVFGGHATHLKEDVFAKVRGFVPLTFEILAFRTMDLFSVLRLQKGLYELNFE
jgi:hypothetical protein